MERKICCLGFQHAFFVALTTIHKSTLCCDELKLIGCEGGRNKVCNERHSSVVN